MKKLALLLSATIFLVSLCGCDNKAIYHSNNSINSDKYEVEDSGYMAYTNFVRKNNSGEYELIFDDLVYDGGEFDLDVEFQFEGRGKKVEVVDALAMFFVDGYIQEFSLDNGEKAMVHNISFPNNKLVHVNYKSVLSTYDDRSEKHTISAVILPYWELGMDNFIKNTVIMSFTREITLNKLHKIENNNIVQMNTREKTEWDELHSELPFKSGALDTDLVFHSFNNGKTCCYVFCGDELISQNGSFIFESNNSNPNMVSFQNISVKRTDIGKPLFVLYVPKDIENPSIERTCNYLWERME